MNILQKISLSILSITLFTTSFISTLSHGDGKTFEKVISSYFVDVGYSDDTAVDSPLQLDFEIYKSSNSTSTENKAPFTDIWVRLEKDSTTMLATGIHRPEFGRAGILYVPQEAGTYTVHFRFENDDVTLAESSFDIEVTDNRDMGAGAVKMIYIIIGSLTIILIIIIISSKRRNEIN